MTAASPTLERRRGVFAQTRYRIASFGAIVVLLTVITLGGAVNAYQVAYELFRGIAEVNSTTVDASEAALQYAAQASQAAADYALLNSDTPLFEQAQNNIFRYFASFRDQLAILEGNLRTDAERSAFVVAETITYSRFWRHVSTLVAQRTNEEVARREYLDADNHVRSWINPALETLESLNYEQMVRAGEEASGILRTQTFLFAVPAFALIVALFWLSMRVRRTLHRYLTLGIDAALVLSLVLTVLILIQLLNAPSQFNTMIHTAYESVTGGSRVLVDVNAANRAESSAMIDLPRLESWNATFDASVNRVASRLCGEVNCIHETFLAGRDQISLPVRNGAQKFYDENASTIDNVLPLVANAYFTGEANALEEARAAFVEYLTAHERLNAFLQSGDLDSAIALNTSTEAGSSQESFERFTAAITRITQINRDVFDAIWQSAGASLGTNMLLYGVAGFALVGVLAAFGTMQRFREL